MNRRSLILTHGAVFSVGIAAAMVTTRLRPLDPELASEKIRTSVRTTIAARLDERTFARNDDKAPADRLQSLLRITDPLDRQRVLIDLIDTLGAGEFAGLADQFGKLDHLCDSRGEYDMILRGWAKVDPLSALKYVAKQGNSRAGLATILSTWADTNATAAERWVMNHHVGDGPNPLMTAVIQGVAAQDLDHASRLAQAMPASRERGEAVEAISRALIMQGMDAAMAFPPLIQDNCLRSAFAASIANRLAAKDPTLAAKWISTMSDSDQKRAARSVGVAMARNDLKQATQWVTTLKPEARAEAARGIIPIMSATDIAGTAQWTTGLAGTPNYDSVVEEFVWSCNSRAPEQSAAWIQAVSDPDQQRRLYHRMLGEWAQKDASAVRKWVASNKVPPEILHHFSR